MKNRLTYGMAIFFLFTFVVFAFIVINEKHKLILIPKVEKQMISYIDKNYKDLNQGKAKYSASNNSYNMKVYNKDNKNLYFMVYYENKNISDTYKKDYLEGKTLLDFYQNKIKDDLTNKYYNDINIKFTHKLNKYTKLVQDRLIKNENITELSIYNINVNITINDFNKDSIIKEIKALSNYINSKGYNPKSLIITITDKKDITKSVEIKGINKDNINNLDSIIGDIIDNKELDDKYSITYKYLN